MNKKRYKYSITKIFIFISSKWNCIHDYFSFYNRIIEKYNHLLKIHNIISTIFRTSNVSIVNYSITSVHHAFTDLRDKSNLITQN